MEKIPISIATGRCRGRLLYFLYAISKSDGHDCPGNARKTDNSAKYAISVQAEDRGAPEGLLKVLDMLNSSIQPMTTGPAAAPTDPTV